MDISWLGELEDKVRQTTAEVRGLRQENQKLRQKVGRLEKKAAGAAAVSDPEGDWVAERDEVRGRLEHLVAGLEELLAE